VVWSRGAYDLGVKSSEGFRRRQGWNKVSRTVLLGMRISYVKTGPNTLFSSSTLASVN
jgi:hypothetical protein